MLLLLLLLLPILHCRVLSWSSIVVDDAIVIGNAKVFLIFSISMIFYFSLPRQWRVSWLGISRWQLRIFCGKKVTRPGTGVLSKSKAIFCLLSFGTRASCIQGHPVVEKVPRGGLGDGRNLAASLLVVANTDVPFPSVSFVFFLFWDCTTLLLTLLWFRQESEPKDRSIY